MNVVAAAEGLGEQPVLGKVRQQPQLDLRVIGGKQHVAELRNECRADLAAKLSTNGNVLQVWIIRRQPAGRGTDLIERGVQALRALIQQHWKRINVGRFQL